MEHGHDIHVIISAPKRHYIHLEVKLVRHLLLNVRKETWSFRTLSQTLMKTEHNRVVVPSHFDLRDSDASYGKEAIVTGYRELSIHLRRFTA